MLSTLLILILCNILQVGCEDSVFKEDAGRYLRVGYSKQGKTQKLTELSVTYKPFKMVSTVKDVEKINLEVFILMNLELIHD